MIRTGRDVVRHIDQTMCGQHLRIWAYTCPFATDRVTRRLETCDDAEASSIALDLARAAVHLKRAGA